ncbi:hypothetical protein CEE45_15975 [Candidatus Heimdallarchaeota archaeon B3_Heim]|nr:MAG: hypothetical protein CEE45_15975 [Candidatus Heimdallarchaeota archaeon B3_Heim]
MRALIIRQRVNWRYCRGVIAILLLTLSIFTFFGISPTNIITQHRDSPATGLFPNIDITSGLYQQLEVREFLHDMNHPQMTVSPVIQSVKSRILIERLQGRFEQISSLTAMTLGPLAYELYKLVRSSQDWKEGGNNRELIMMTITNTPGITLRGITRAADIAMGSAQYWIQILEREDEIDSLVLGKSKHHFDLKQQWTTEAKLLYSLIQNKHILEILQCLNENPTITTQKDLCTNLGIHKALISYYIKILKNHKVIEHQMRDLSISTSYKDYLN